MKIVFEKKYDDESIVDLERDMYEAINESDGPVDEHGFHTGTFKVIIMWESDDNDIRD